MTWGRPAMDNVCRIHYLDRTGLLSPEHPRIIGAGARSWNVQTDPGEPELDLDPDFPASVRYGNLRVHVQTRSEQEPAYVGLGNFVLEVFTHGPEQSWLYTLFPTLIGRLLAFKTTDGLWSVTVTGRTRPNPMLGELVKGFATDKTATMITGITHEHPYIPA